MAGKRQKKQNRRRLPGILMLLCALVLVVSPASPAGVAADSPLEQTVSAAAEMPVFEPEFVLLPREPVPGLMPLEAVEEPATEEPEVKEPWAPVKESPAVEDTYFADAAFLGDSRTDGLRLYSGLKTTNYFCATGATVESVFSKKVWGVEGSKIPLLDALAKQENCNKIYVMLGVNELGWGKVETFRGQYTKLIERLRADHPDAQIVIQSILPVSARQDAKKTYVNNERILKYNEAILSLAEEMDCAYLNVAEAVIGEDGCLKSELTSDGVHLNIRGCKIWLEYLRTHSLGGDAEPVEAEVSVTPEIPPAEELPVEANPVENE